MGLNQQENQPIWSTRPGTDRGKVEYSKQIRIMNQFQLGIGACLTGLEISAGRQFPAEGGRKQSIISSATRLIPPVEFLIDSLIIQKIGSGVGK